MTSPDFPEPPPAVAATSLADVDRALDELASKADAWVATGIAKRIELLRACIETTVACGEEWVAAACRAKGIQPGTAREGEEWLGGPMTVVRNLRLLVESLEQGGQPKPKKISRRGGQVIAEVFPADLFDKALFTGFRAEVWMEPGREATQGRIYRDKAAGRTPEGKVSLVLGAGNVASIGPMDALYKLFAEDEVVIVKTNPVNAYLGPYWEKSLGPLIREGYVRIVHGGAEVGAHLTSHDRVDTIHMTGSDRTYDAIVWGTDPKERERRKAAGTPINTRPISAELGAVTPVLVVPGPWNDVELDYQARHVAGMVANNGSFNCNAAKVVVTSKRWSQRDAFLAKLKHHLAKTPPRKAYYPGAQDRYQAFLDHYPQAQPLGQRTDDIVPWTIIPDVAADASEYALTNEAFCGVLALCELDVADPGEFLRRGTEFANDTCWGSLSMMMLIHPKTQKQYGDAFEAAIRDLRYGGIGVNTWAGVIYGLVATTWGAFPGHPPEDIRSGNGVVHNTYLFDHPQKSVVYAPFVIKPTPVWFPDHKTTAQVGRALTHFEAKPSLLALPKVALPALKG